MYTHGGSLPIVYIQHGVSAVDVIAVGDLCYLHLCGSRYPAILEAIPYSVYEVIVCNISVYTLWLLMVALTRGN